MIASDCLGDAEYTTGPEISGASIICSRRQLSGAAAPGYSSGEVMRKMENIAKTHLPENIGVEWSGLSYQEKKPRTAGAGIDSGIPVRLPLSGCFIRKLAGAGSCVVALPLLQLWGLIWAFWDLGPENDIYFQIGLVTLIGLAAKKCDFDCGVCQDGSRQRGRWLSLPKMRPCCVSARS